MSLQWECDVLNSDRLVFKIMNFAFKITNFALTIMNSALKIMNFALKLMLAVPPPSGSDSR